MEKRFPLKWRNHVSSLLQTIQIKAPYTDASLACDGKVYQVHRVILSSCSEYFRDLFRQTAAESPFIILAGIESKNVEYLIHYMYKGEVNVTEGEIGPLLEAAEYLKIKGLTLAVRNTDTQLLAKCSRDLTISDHGYNPPKKKKKMSDNILTVLSGKGFDTNLAAYCSTNYGNPSYSTDISKGIEDYSSNLNYIDQTSALQLTKDHYTNPQDLYNVPTETTGEPLLTNTLSKFWTSGYSASRNELTPSTPVKQKTCDTSTGNQNEQSSTVTLGTKGDERKEEVSVNPSANILNEENDTDISEAYSSDDDPIMVSRIRKIVRKTYKNLITKMRKNSSVDISGNSLPPCSPFPRNTIIISTINKSDGRNSGGRVNYCYFCNSPQTQIWRHIKTIHKAESQVARLSETSEDSDQKQEIDLLRNLGNFHHNKEVLQAGNGELKVYRRADNARLCYKSYLPCPKCLLFQSKNDLWRHCRYRCMTHSLSLDGRGNTASFRHLLFMATAVLGVQSNFKKNEKKVLQQVKEDDDVARIAVKDEIIFHLGSYIYENLRGDRPDVVRQSMRLSARILLQVRLRTNQHYLTLFQVLRPPYIDIVTESVTLISHYLRAEEPTSNLATFPPQKVALQLRILLRKCLAVKLGIALRTHSEEDRRDAKAFDASMDKLASELDSASLAEEKTLSDFLEVEMEGEEGFVDDDDDIDFKDDVLWEGQSSVVGEILEAEAREAGIDVTSTANARSTAALRRMPYSPAENEAILKYFGDQIDKKQIIRKEDIEKLFSNPFYEGELNSRSWKNIKYKVHNLIQKKNKCK